MLEHVSPGLPGGLIAAGPFFGTRADPEVCSGWIREASLDGQRVYPDTTKFLRRKHAVHGQLGDRVGHGNQNECCFIRYTRCREDFRRALARNLQERPVFRESRWLN
jgi:hypothetical protein